MQIKTGGVGGGGGGGGGGGRVTHIDNVCWAGDPGVIWYMVY